MQKHIVYLVTDANRRVIQADYCSNITQRIIDLQEAAIRFVFGKARLSRVVYTEEFDSFEDAQLRKMELSTFTHMMKERLIRRQNPNWLGMVSAASLVSKKAVAYA